MVRMISTDILTDIANAIRTKTSTSDTIKTEDFAENILSISGGGLPSNMEMVEYTPTEDLDLLTITNPRSSKPRLAICTCHNAIINNTINTVAINAIMTAYNEAFFSFASCVSGTGGGMTQFGGNESSMSGSIDDTSVTFGKRTSYWDKIKYRTGCKYTIIFYY